MTDKIAFFYLHGTDPILGQVAKIVGDAFSQPRTGLLTVPGLNGATATWMDGSPKNDCFPNLLDTNIFQPVKVGYPALGIPMGVSLSIGVTNLVNAINALPNGQRFMIGGYSQGAAAASSVELLLRPGGSLSAKAPLYLGGCVFGNPRRQGGNYRGEVGGTWSGAWDNPGSTTGGHGSFPTTGPYPRLTNCDPTKWIEITEVGDIFSSTGDTPTGLGWTNGNAAFVELLNIPAILAAIASLPAIQAAFDYGGLVTEFTDAVGKVFSIGGNGHAAYPWRPPPGNPDNNLSSFQIAAKWATSKANAFATAPILLPPTPATVSNAGWTTTLIPPAA
jgi:hypothetical protein